MFSSPVKDVAETKIFARRTSRTSQALVYSMQYHADAELAMILPLPKAIESGKDAVTFIDLSGYPRFFDDMETGFSAALSFDLPRSTAGPVLKVHDVGNFEASWVPAISEFARLDGRFRLPAAIWKQLPQYADYGFAVFKLKSGNKSLHPIALEFQTRERSRIFFPTVHVHNGSIEPEAFFDHSLYCQSKYSGSGWIASATLTQKKRRLENEPLLAKDFMSVDRSMGLLLSDQVILKMSRVGTYPNEDFWGAG